MIDVPNSTNISQLKLTEVLYSPEVGYTLVSVGHLDDKGFAVTFSGSQCTIRGPDGSLELTIDQFHCRMGHISVGVAQKLVEKGFVTGVRLESW